MSLSNHNLFEMINASPGAGEGWSCLGLLLAHGPLWGVLGAMVLAWVRADAGGRRDLVILGAAALATVVLSELVGVLWPQPRPVALHMGVQLSPFPWRGASMPSDEAAVLVALGAAAFMTRTLAIFAFPLLTLALLTAWGLVYSGEHFPYDVAASVPAGLVCAALAPRVVACMPVPLRRRLRLADDVARPDA